MTDVTNVGPEMKKEKYFYKKIEYYIVLKDIIRQGASVFMGYNNVATVKILDNPKEKIEENCQLN